MPEWLLKKENYSPVADKDGFVNKSIFSLLRVLSHIRSQNGCTADLFYVSAIFKVAFTILLIILLSVTRSFVFVEVSGVYLLILLSFMKGEELVKILKVSFLAALFALIIMLPAFLLGNSYSGIMIPAKAFANVTAVGILSHSTKWNSLTDALRRFYVPNIFIFVLDITIKYIVLLGEYSLNLLYSLKLRSVGKNKSKYSSLSGVMGTMFLKSKEMSEELYSAMECRGFTGEYPVVSRFRFRLADLIYSIINIGIVAAFVYFERV